MIGDIMLRKYMYSIKENIFDINGNYYNISKVTSVLLEFMLNFNV